MRRDESLVADVADDQRARRAAPPRRSRSTGCRATTTSRPRRAAPAPCGCRCSRRRPSQEPPCRSSSSWLSVQPIAAALDSLNGASTACPAYSTCAEVAFHTHEAPSDEAHPQGRVSRRRARHPLPARHQGHAEGDADRGRPAGRSSTWSTRRGPPASSTSSSSPGATRASIEDHFDISFELERTLAERGKTKELEALAARPAAAPARRASRASRRRSASATRSGARATSSATSRSRCCCPTCCTTAPGRCLAEMIEAYERARRQPHRRFAGARRPDAPVRHRRRRGRARRRSRASRGWWRSRRAGTAPSNLHISGPLHPAAGGVRASWRRRSAAPAARSSSPTP